jgi:hypothetical protein
MNKNLLNKKIPTVVGLLVLLLGIGAGVFFLGRKSFFPKLKPAPEATPKKVKISNVSDKSFSVSWITETSTVGFLKYGDTASIDQKIADVRDEKSGEKQELKTHFVTIENLQPQTKYYFKIGSGKGMGSTLYDNNGKPYTVTTGTQLGTPGEAKMISGTVVDQTEKPVQGAIVYLSTPKSAPQATLTDKQGGWVLFINKARSRNLDSWALLDSKNTLNLEVIGKGQTTKVVSNLENSSPLPEDIVLGHQPYDFRKDVTTKEEELAVKPKETNNEQTETKTPESFPMDPLAENNSQTVTIDYPETNGEEIASQTPQFFGTGPTGKVLTLKIPGENITSTITINKDGEWQYTPISKLAIGTHTISISYVDNNGAQQTKQKTFSITTDSNKGGTDLPAFESTPSAQASPSPSPQTRVSMPSTESGVPETGTTSPTFIVFITGLTAISLGFLGRTKFDKNKQFKS